MEMLVQMMSGHDLHFLGTLFIMIIGWAAKSLSAMSTDIKKLNIHMATIVEKVNSHEHRIKKLERKGH